MQKRTNDQLFVLGKKDQIQKLKDVLTGKITLPDEDSDNRR
jgi:hypothetical protein